MVKKTLVHQTLHYVLILDILVTSYLYIYLQYFTILYIYLQYFTIFYNTLHLFTILYNIFKSCIFLILIIYLSHGTYQQGQSGF